MVAEEGCEINGGYFRRGDNRLLCCWERFIWEEEIVESERDEIIEERKSRTQVDGFVWLERWE